MRNGKVREGDLANALLAQVEKQNSTSLQQGKKLSWNVIEQYTHAISRDIGLADQTNI
jgi:hypothetical protein